METIKEKLLMLTSGLLLFLSIDTCEREKTRPTMTPGADQWIIANYEKRQSDLRKSFEERLARLQTQNDSLKTASQVRKKQLQFFRQKAHQMKQELEARLSVSDNVDPGFDTTRTLTLGYIEAQRQTDSACSNTVVMLESVVFNQDSIIQTQQANNLLLTTAREVDQQRLVELTETINRREKALRKQKRKDSWLRTGLVIVTGITASLLITSHLR